MVTPRELGKIFKEAREKKGISVNEVNKKSRIDVHLIQEFENGVFDRIGKIYTRSFIKKYSDFLGLDTEEILKKFEAIAKNINEKDFSFTVEEEDDKVERSKEVLIFTKKNIQIALIAGLSLLLVVLFIVLVGKIKTKFSSSGREKPAAVRVVKLPRTPARTAAVRPPRTIQKPKITSKEVQQLSVNLTLRATGEVWVKVMEGDEQVFVGTLQEGESKSWSANGPLTVWSGKAERLIFTINTHRVGAVAAGVVKNIEVTAKGVKVNGNWVVYL